MDVITNTPFLKFETKDENFIKCSIVSELRKRKGGTRSAIFPTLLHTLEKQNESNENCRKGSETRKSYECFLG